jgi:drug/metabolite transporter (DMT)-like permease
MKYYLVKVNSIAATVWALVLIGPISTIYLFSTDFTDRLINTPVGIESFLYVCVLGLFGTTISMIMFNMLLKRSGPVFGASVTYLVPSVAMFWGVFDGEFVGIIHIVAISTILLGVYLVNKKSFS